VRGESAVSHAEFDRLLRESYTELCRVTKEANDIERRAGELRARAGELALRIHIVLGTAPPFDAANPATHDHGRKL